MANKSLEWKVGLFLLIGLVLVGSLVLIFSKGTSLFQPTYNLYLTAENVAGLRPKASVLMAGVKVGNVSNIRLNQAGTNVTITLSIEKEYSIHQDCRFVIQQSGLLGDEYVAIIPTRNAAPVFKPGGHATAEEPFNLQQVARSAAGFIQRIDEMAKQVNETIAEVRRSVMNEETLTNLAVTVQTMRVASQHALNTVDNVNALVKTNSPSVGLAMSNVVYFSQQINEFGHTFGGVLATNSTDISAAVSNIESSTVVLRSLLDDIQSGKGLAGSVLKDQALATNVGAIAKNLSITSSNLNRLGLWGILWAKKPPRTNTVPEHPLTSPRNPFK